MHPLKKVSLRNGTFLKDMVPALGLCLNQAAAYSAAFVWKLELLYYLILILFFTSLFSIYIRNLTKSIAYSVTSVIVGAIIGLGILLIPPLVYGSYEMINATTSIYLTFVAKLAIFNLVICMFSSTVGTVLSGGE